MHNTLRAEIDVMHIPTDAKIARHQQSRLLTELADSLNHDLTEADAWVTKIARDTGLQFQEIAASAIQVLAKERGATLEAPPDDPKPKTNTKNESLPHDDPEDVKRHRARGVKPKKRGNPRGGKGLKKRSGRKRNPQKGMRKGGRSGK
jgi:hypothetical protein